MAINVTINEGDGEAVSVDVATGFVAHTHTYSDLVGLGEDIQDVIGIMISDNTENGIAITYDDATGKLNFDVNDPLITFTGDVTGSGTITNLGNTSFEMTVTDNSHNHLASNVTDFTEATQDVVGGMVTENTENGISVTYDDETGKLNFDVADPTISISGDATGSAVMTDLGNVDVEIDLSNTGVIADTYGSASVVSQFTVDEDGRITSAEDVTIDIPSTQVNDFTEAAQDSAASLIDHSDHTNITVSYDDENNKITFVAAGNVLSVNTFTGEVVLDTDDIDEGTTNLYFTDDRAKDSAGDLIANSTKTGLSATYSSSTNSLTLSNDGVLDITAGPTVLNVIDSGLGNFELEFPDEVVIPNNLTVSGNFTVLGGTTSIETTVLNVEDNNITLNSNLSIIDAPVTEPSGIYVNRGQENQVALLWNENNLNWETVETDGTTRILGAVQSVNGFTGDITLSTLEISENQQLYFTSERAIDSAIGYLSSNNTDPNITLLYSPTTPGPQSLDLSINSAPKVVINGRNNTGVEIGGGTVVFIFQHSLGQNVSDISVASYDNISSMPAIGITESSILNGEIGRVVVFGEASISTRVFNEVSQQYEQIYNVGEYLYVGFNGELVAIENLPTAAVQQRLGIISKLEDDNELGSIFISGSGNYFEYPVLESNKFLLGAGDNTQAIPTLFSLENLTVEGVLSLPAPATVQPGQIHFNLTDGKYYYSNGGAWYEFSVDGHSHIPSDIIGLGDTVFDYVDDFIGLQLNLSGLTYDYDPVLRVGNLSVQDPTITLSVSGDLTGTASGQLNDLSNFSIDIPVTYDRDLFGQYVYDSMAHTRHSNITVDFDLDPEGSLYPQIIINAPDPYTQEEIQDFVSPLFIHSNHTNLTATYDDNANQILFAVPDSVDLIQFGTRPAVNGNVTVGLVDITSALGYTPISNTDAETVTDLLAPAIVHDNNVNIIATYDDDNDRIVLEAQNAGAASVGSLTNSWWLGA